MPTTKQRRICIQCGCKRVVDQMQAIGIKHGTYFQANREVEGYVCLSGCLEKFKKDKKYSPYHNPV